MNFIPTEKAFPIRQPSTANLMLDSANRTVSSYPTPWDFSISRTNSLLNGFFTRIGTSEVVLEWNIPNISASLGNNTITITVTAGATHVLTLPDGNYTVAEALSTIASLADTAFTPLNFNVVQNGQQVSLDLVGGGTFLVLGVLAYQLGLPIGAIAASQLVSQPDLRTFRYLDFISAQLTYNQDLKDASTAPIVRDVLCRWYMAWDVPVEYDSLGFPILMGYKTFTCRRIFSPPKQIRWDSSQPIGQISFQVYGYGQNGTNYTDGVLLSQVFPTSLDNWATNWLMTLQVSEV